MQEATLLDYSSSGALQSKKSIKLKRIGLSHRSLGQGLVYRCTNCDTERGKDGKVQLQYLRSCHGAVCVQYEYANNQVKPGKLLELVTEAGGIAFVAAKEFALPENFISPIPVYFSSEKIWVLWSQKICMGKVPPSFFSKWAIGKGIHETVIQDIESCGVQTMEDAALLFSKGKDRCHRERLEKEALEAKENEVRRVIFPKNFSLKDIGVGGMGKDFEFVFRRLFTTRMFSVEKLSMLGISHCKGLLLCGPPGCGKTLLARRLSKLLKTSNVKIISGPEVFNKWLGQSEENVRDLFKDAEAEWKKKGNKSSLHVVIIDEIDAMCGKRSQANGHNGSRVANSVVNQLLAKMDGVEQLNNILLIGMTNRKEAMDPSLLRPGRFELHLEIGLPDETGRREILDIHTQKMRDGGLLDEACLACLSEIATATEHFSGAEIECVVKAACSYAMDRCIDSTDLSLPPDESLLKIQPSDFHRALEVLSDTSLR